MPLEGDWQRAELARSMTLPVRKKCHETHVDDHRRKRCAD